MATDFLNYKIDNALIKHYQLEGSGSHRGVTCAACAGAETIGKRPGLRHVHALYATMAAALLAGCALTPSLVLPPLIGLVPGGSHAPTYNWSGWQCGVFVSTVAAGQALGAAAAGAEAGRAMLMAALLVHGVLLIAMPNIIYTAGLWGACAATTAVGVARTALLPGLRGMLMRWLPPHEYAWVAWIVYAGVPAGIVAALTACAALVATSPGWPLALYIAGALALSAVVVLLLLTADAPDKLRAVSDEERDYILAHQSMRPKMLVEVQWHRLLRSRAAWAAACGQFGCDLPYWLLLYLMPMYFTRVLNYDYSQSAALCASGVALSWVATWARPRRPVRFFGLELTLSDRELHAIGALGATACIAGVALLGAAGGRAVAAALLAPAFSALQAATLVESQVAASPCFAESCVRLRAPAAAAAGVMVAAGTVVAVARAEESVAWCVLLLCMATAVLACALVFLIFGFDDSRRWEDDLLPYADKTAALELQRLKSNQE